MIRKNIFAKILFFSLCFISIVKANTIAPGAIEETLLNLGYVAVPLQRASNQNALLIKGSFDNKNVGFFILDTGGTDTEIDPVMAKKIALKKENNSIIMGGGDAIRHRVFKSIIPTLRFGNYVSRNEPVYIVDQSPKRVDKKSLIGLIGMDYLRQHHAIIDIAHQKLYLKYEDKLSRDSLTVINQVLLQKGYDKQPLNKTPTGHVLVAVSTNNSKAENFLFDSGAPFSMLSLDLANFLKLKLKKSLEIGGSGGGKIQAFQAHIEDLSIGITHWSPPNITVMDFKNIKVGIPVHGIIGIDWMQANNVIFDVKNNLLFTNEPGRYRGRDT